MILRLAVAAGIALASAAAAAQQFRSDLNEIATAQGPAFDVRQRADGSLIIKLFDDEQRFVAPPTADRNAALIDMLQQSGGRSVTVRYRAAQGSVLSDADTIVYQLCSVASEDRKIDVARCDEPAQPADLSREGQVGLAYALTGEGAYARATKLVTDILAFGEISARERRLALRARSSAESGLGGVEVEASAARDRHNIAALSDLRVLIAGTPRDVELRFEMARLLEDLGAYAEARQVYADILKSFSDEDFRVSIRRGAIARREGNYAVALSELDDMAKRLGPQAGMKFHYHRAWTLTLLERYDEAVVEIGKGLQSQPDYSGAFMRRACAYAHLGQLREASADLARADQLYRSYIPQTDPVIASGIARMAVLQQSMSAAIAAGRNVPMPEVCNGFPGYDEVARKRSALLPAA